MLLGNLALAALSLGVASAGPIIKRNFNYEDFKIQGVCLGGWLVLEPWITPSIFNPYDVEQIYDEFTLTTNLGNARDIMFAHWSTWVTLDDFERIAGAGFNAVRIPIGYWAFQKYEGDPYIQGAEGFLDQGIAWARQTGLKVWIDLHGAPLSQNGLDNSGQRTPDPGFTTGDSVSFTTGVMQQIADKYAITDYDDVIIGIEVLNEPELGELAGGRVGVEGYYYNAYGAIRGISDMPVVLHDGFDPPASWNEFGGYDVVIDHHYYQVFSDAELALSHQEHVAAVCPDTQSWAANMDKYLVVGEWSGAMTDCAAGLNGWGNGSRYAGNYPGSTYVGSCDTINYIDTWDQSMLADTRTYIEAQMDIFEEYTQGWFWWNFKTEASPEWDLFRLLDYGVFPQPLSDRYYTNTC